MALLLSTPGLVAFLLTQICSGEHEEGEKVVRGLCGFLLGLAILYNDGSVEGYTAADLKALVEKRIGVEVFVDKIGDIQRSEAFNKAVKHPQIQVANMAELMLDNRFCELFRSLDREVTGVVAKKQVVNGNGVEGGVEMESEASNIALEQYKQFIREQDQRMKEFVEANTNLNQQLITTRSHLEEMTAQVELLRDHNSILQAQAINSVTAAPSPLQEDNAVKDTKVEVLEQAVEQLQGQLRQQGEYVLELEARLGGMFQQQNVVDVTADNGSQATTETICQGSQSEIGEATAESGSQATTETSCQGSQSDVQGGVSPGAWIDSRNNTSQTEAQAVEPPQNNPEQEILLQQSQMQIDKLRKQLESMHAVLNAKNHEIIELKNDLPLRNPTGKPVDRFENMFMTSLEVEQNSKKLDQMEAELKNQELQKLRENDQKEMEALRGERDELKKDLVDTRNRLEELEKTRVANNSEDLESQLIEAGEKLKELQSLRDEKILQLQEKTNDVTNQLSEANEQIETLQSEQEDLLVMLSDQETQIQEYRSQLKELGVEDVEETEDLT